MGKPQTFRSPTAILVWVVWLLFAVGNWIDLAVQGRDHESAVAAAILLLATGIAYVVAQRPRLTVDGTGLSIRNPLRNHRIGWAAVVKADVIDLVRVHCAWGDQTKVVSVWAVHHSRRRQLVAESRARREARRQRSPARLSFGGGRAASYGTAPPVPAPAAEAEAEQVVRLLDERAAAASGPAVAPESRWSGPAIAALVVPALILLVVWLL